MQTVHPIRATTPPALPAYRHPHTPQTEFHHVLETNNIDVQTNWRRASAIL